MFVLLFTLNNKTMKKTYFIIPANPFWVDKSIVESIYTHYLIKSVAIDKAEKLSRQYNEAFIVCSHETKVETLRTLIDYNK